jgi:hypothetical protein
MQKKIRDWAKGRQRPHPSKEGGAPSFTFPDFQQLHLRNPSSWLTGQ